MFTTQLLLRIIIIITTYLIGALYELNVILNLSLDTLECPHFKIWRALLWFYRQPVWDYIVWRTLFNLESCIRDAIWLFCCVCPRPLQNPKNKTKQNPKPNKQKARVEKIQLGNWGKLNQDYKLPNNTQIPHKLQPADSQQTHPPTAGILGWLLVESPCA